MNLVGERRKFDESHVVADLHTFHTDIVYGDTGWLYWSEISIFRYYLIIVQTTFSYRKGRGMRPSLG